MHDWFRQIGCPEIIVANKLDKLKRSQVEPALALIRETLELTDRGAGILFFAGKSHKQAHRRRIRKSGERNMLDRIGFYLDNKQLEAHAENRLPRVV